MLRTATVVKHKNGTAGRLSQESADTTRNELVYLEGSMSTYESRQRNAAKQRRFRQRHASRLRVEAMQRQIHHDGAPDGRRPTWRCVELVDPRDGLPRCVLVVKADDVPWGPLQRRQRPGRAGRWLAELLNLGLVPRLGTWLPRVVVSRRVAARLKVARVAQIAAWAGGTRPTWLL